MANIKVAISIPEPLFERVEAMAHEMDVPRSHIFAEALEEYVQRRQNQQLLERLNAVYASGLDEDERRLLQAHKRAYRKVLEEEE
jgi:metal-responsive CopG/Arc/MetJ family transcriptional regulator